MTSTSVHKSGSGGGGSLVLALGCGCTDSHSVSVSNTFRTNHAPTQRRRHPPALCSPDALSQPSPSSSYDEPQANTASSPSFSELLRQLKAPAAVDDVSRDRGKERSQPSSGRASKRVEESVVVVKETVDPLGEFRRSMLHMIVEKEIVEGAELRALLRRFLLLNSPRHHGVILRAFAEVWEQVFVGGHEGTPDLFSRQQRHSRICDAVVEHLVYASLIKHCTSHYLMFANGPAKRRKQNQAAKAASAAMLGASVENDDANYSKVIRLTVSSHGIPVVIENENSLLLQR